MSATQTPIAYSIEEGGHLSLKIITLNSIEIAQQCVDNHEPFNWVGKDITRGRGSGISVLKWHENLILIADEAKPVEDKQYLPSASSHELRFSVIYFPHPETKETIIWDSITGIFVVGINPIKADSVPRSLHDFIELIDRHDKAWGKINSFQRKFLHDPKRN